MQLALGSILSHGPLLHVYNPTPITCINIQLFNSIKGNPPPKKKQTTKQNKKTHKYKDEELSKRKNVNSFV